MTNKVIVRGAYSGTFYGILRKQSGNSVELSVCKRFVSFGELITCEELATYGPKKMVGYKLSKCVPSLQILDAVEIVPVSNTADNLIRQIKDVL